NATNDFVVTATDAATNESVAADVPRITNDSTAPGVAIDSATPSPTTGGVTVTWHANENGAYSVRVGGSDCLTGTQVASGSYSSQPNTVATSIAGGSLAE